MFIYICRFYVCVESFAEKRLLFSLCKKTKKYMVAICEYMREILFKIFLKAFKIHILKNGYKYPSYIYSPYSHAWSCGYVENSHYLG